MHGNTAPYPAAPQALSIVITNTGSYSLIIGVFDVGTIASDNSDLIAKVQAALPDGWHIGYSDVQATTAELSIYPPSGAGAITAEVSGDATAEVQPYQGAYFESLPTGSFYFALDYNDLYVLAPKQVETGIVRNAWTKIDG